MANQRIIVRVSNASGDLLENLRSTTDSAEYASDDGFVIIVQSLTGHYAMIRVDKLGKIV